MLKKELLSDGVIIESISDGAETIVARFVELLSTGLTLGVAVLTDRFMLSHLIFSEHLSAMQERALEQF